MHNREFSHTSEDLCVSMQLILLAWSDMSTVLPSEALSRFLAPARPRLRFDRGQTLVADGSAARVAPLR